jgi:hypothetical protein
VSETPNERRERIDGARREQAELLRQIGHDHANNVIRPSAMEAWRNLQVKLVNVDERSGRRPCRGKEAEYSDYDAFNVPSPGRAKMMCGGCEAFAECDLYAQVANPTWSVYGGNVYGKTLADRERREYIKVEVAKARAKKEEA